MASPHSAANTARGSVLPSPMAPLAAGGLAMARGKGDSISVYLSVCLSVCLSIYTYIENTCLLWHIQYTSIHIYAHIDTHTQTHRQTHAHTLDTASSGEQLHGAGWSETSHLLATKACLCPRLARNINHQR